MCENKTDLVRGDGDGGGDESSRGCDGRGEECPLSSQIVYYSYFPLSHFCALSVLLLKDLSPASQLSDAILVIMASRPGTR